MWMLEKHMFGIGLSETIIHLKAKFFAIELAVWFLDVPHGPTDL